MAILFITHDLGVVAHAAKRVIVMYVGRILEEAPAVEIFGNPMHPYTQGLMESIPKVGEKLHKGKRQLVEIKGVVPSLLNLPPGCAFRERCPRADEACKEPPEMSMSLPGHRVRCFHPHLN